MCGDRGGSPDFCSLLISLRPLWDDDDEHIYAVLEKRAFTIVIATDREDRDAAVAAMSLPSPDSTLTPP